MGNFSGDSSDQGVTEMSVAEFRRLGLLQELNRRFLHPIGLGLEVVVISENEQRFGRIWDYRSDPEGLKYLDSDISVTSIAIYDSMLETKRPVRVEVIGGVVQEVTAPASPEE